jgi:hypothetical protein
MGTNRKAPVIVPLPRFTLVPGEPGLMKSPLAPNSKSPPGLVAKRLRSVPGKLFDVNWAEVAKRMSPDGGRVLLIDSKAVVGLPRLKTAMFGPELRVREAGDRVAVPALMVGGPGLTRVNIPRFTVNELAVAPTRGEVGTVIVTVPKVAVKALEPLGALTLA